MAVLGIAIFPKLVHIDLARGMFVSLLQDDLL